MGQRHTRPARVTIVARGATRVLLFLVLVLMATVAVAQRRVANPGETQFDVQVLRPTGGPVIPLFEGWYRNPDGTFEVSFGYFNVNTEEVVEIPLGPDNVIDPPEFDGRQPTRFEPVPEGDRRHWGVFTVAVPADFGDRDVVWTLHSQGQTLSVPGRLTSPSYELSGLAFPGRASMAPLVTWDPDGPVGRGPAGVTGPEIEATAGVPLTLRVWTTRDEAARDDERPITLQWFTHQGPAAVTFAEPTLSIDREVWAAAPDGVEAATDATFPEPGDYMLRVLAYNEVREFEFHCCWTNGYVRVRVSP